MYIDWTSSQPGNIYVYAEPENFIIEILYNKNIDWMILSEKDIRSGSVLLSYGGVNTIYMLRGRGLNSTWGDGNNSDTYGPYVVYQDTEVPIPMDVSVSPKGLLTIEVTWSFLDSCYQVLNYDIVCDEDQTFSNRVISKSTTGEVSSIIFSQLRPDTYYICRVLGRIVGKGELVGDAGSPLLEKSSVSVKSFTLPQGKFKDKTYSSSATIPL